MPHSVSYALSVGFVVEGKRRLMVMFDWWTRCVHSFVENVAVVVSSPEMKCSLKDWMTLSTSLDRWRWW